VKHSSQLRTGEWVEVRSKEEILATLDPNGECDKLRFMPEMLKFCGRRFKVFKRAHKTCDTVGRTGGRCMHNAVHLEGLRCTGEAHGGCQAACLIFWKDAWLKRVSGPALGPNGVAADAGRVGCTEAQVWAATKSSQPADESEPVYACQATLLPQSTSPLKWWDVRQYIEDYTSGNVSLGRIVCGFLYMGYHKLATTGIGLGKPMRWLYDRVQKLRGGIPYPRRYGKIPLGQPTPNTDLNLQPGEVVRVKPLEQILLTLNQANKNKGMYFDAEEVPHCGKTFRVLGRVERIIDERTGKMIAMKSNSVILEGACCQSRYSEKRLFCPRSIYTFWREVWLERVAPTSPASASVGAESQSLKVAGKEKS
jgi:hypothetical protein